jgi:DNA repair exonuclease SbcCD nuclease subunit
MSLKILAIGDPHFRTKYIRTIEQFTQQTIELIKTTAPDLVVVLGDTLHHHERTDSECHVRAVKWFLAISKITRLVVLIGNHDRRNNSDFQTEYHFFTALKDHPNIWVVDHALDLKLVIGEERVRLVFVPYVPPGRFREALNTLEVSVEDRRPLVIFAHQEFKGSKMGAIVSQIGDEWSTKAPLVISGHLHEYQVPQENMFYCGTPFQTTYAESNDKGVYIFTWRDLVSKPEIKRVKLNLRVKRSVTIAPSEVKDFKLPDENVDLRVIISGKQEEVEAVKETVKYQELKKAKNVAVILRPQLEFKPNVKFYQKTYKQALFEEVSNDENLRQLYIDVLGQLQD